MNYTVGRGEQLACHCRDHAVPDRILTYDGESTRGSKLITYTGSRRRRRRTRQRKKRFRLSFHLLGEEDFSRSEVHIPSRCFGHKALRNFRWDEKIFGEKLRQIFCGVMQTNADNHDLPTAPYYMLSEWHSITQWHSERKILVQEIQYFRLAQWQYSTILIHKVVSWCSITEQHSGIILQWHNMQQSNTTD